jgi:hypothetical protein
LRRIPHTFFDAYFSGRYAQDVCDDGSIFVDRDGEHFGHVLQYMRDGVVSVADPGACPSVSLLRALKREFGFYCIEVVAEQAVEPERPEVAYVMGGEKASGGIISSMERYDASSGQWSAAAAMGTWRHQFGVCTLAGDLYVTGGRNADGLLLSVEKYSPSSDTWSAVAPMPAARSSHVAVAVGSAMYVLGGFVGGVTASVLKFDSTEGTWSQVTPMPAARYADARYAHAACAIGSDIYAFGGLGGDQYQASVFKFDTDVNEWHTLAPMPRDCSWHCASVLDGLVYVVGAGLNNRQVMCFDPASAVWSTSAPTLVSRKYGVSFVLGGCLYAAGGDGGYSSVERYDVASNTWEAVVDMLEGRRLFGAVTIDSSGPAEEQDLFDSLIAKASSGQQ